MKKIFFFLIILIITFTSCNPCQSVVKQSASLEGTWQLNYISGPRITFEALYPNKKPTIVFDTKENKISGNNGCNPFFGDLKIEGNKIDFKDAKMGMTMMACQENGDVIFMKTLEKIDSYSISEDGKTLNFMMGEIAMMRFQKQ